MEDFWELIRQGLIGKGQEIVDQVFREGRTMVAVLLPGFLLFFEVALVDAARRLASTGHAVGGLTVRSVYEPVEEVVVGSDAGGVIRVESGHNGMKRMRSKGIDPFGDAGGFEKGHEDEGPQRWDRVAWRSAFDGTIQSPEDLLGRVKVEIEKDEVFSRMGIEHFRSGPAREGGGKKRTCLLNVVFVRHMDHLLSMR